MTKNNCRHFVKSNSNGVLLEFPFSFSIDSNLRIQRCSTMPEKDESKADVHGDTKLENNLKANASFNFYSSLFAGCSLSWSNYDESD